MVSTPYVAFSDSDDEYSLDFVKEAKEYVDKYNPDIVYGTIACVPPKNLDQTDSKVHYFDKKGEIREVYKALLDIPKNDWGLRVSYSQCSRVYLSSLACRIKFDENVSCGEDGIFNRKCVAQANSVLMVSNIWYTYYANDYSITHQKTKTVFQRHRQYYDAFLAINKTEDLEMQKALIVTQYKSFFWIMRCDVIGNEVKEISLMDVLFVVVALLILLYILDKSVCFVYCTMKKRQTRELNSRGKAAGAEQTLSGSRITLKIKRLLYGWMMYSIERLGRVPFQKYRIFILKKIYRMDIGKNVVIYHGFHIRAPWNIRIGKGTIVGDGALLDGRNGLAIGENVNISTDACIYTEQHDINDPYFACADSGGRVVIGDYAWLSSHTTVLPKVTVGKGAVLASGALTAKDLEEYVMYGGVPAKKIGERTRDLKYEFDGTYVPFY